MPGLARFVGEMIVSAYGAIKAVFGVGVAGKPGIQFNISGKRAA